MNLISFILSALVAVGVIVFMPHIAGMVAIVGLFYMLFKKRWVK